MKHNNMRDDEAQNAYIEKQKELFKHADDLDTDFWRWGDTLVDRITIGKDDRLTIPPTNPIRSVPGGNDHKEEMSLIRALLVFALENVGEKGQSTFDDLMERYDKLREEASKSDEGADSVPDSDDYKERYEQAMNILGAIFTLYDPPISFSDTEWINRINTQCQCYKELRDSE